MIQLTDKQEKAILSCVQMLRASNTMHSITGFFSKKERIRLTRKAYKNGFAKEKFECTLTIGKPNFLEREYLRKKRTTDFSDLPILFSNKRK